MDSQYSYEWYIKQFEDAKDTAEKFILSTDEAHFLQPPAEGKWSIAEIYSHLIKFGDLYYRNMSPGITNTQKTTEDFEQSFRPGWIVRKVISFFDPPYNMKIKTLKVMKPQSVSDYNRMELLDEYVNLQDRFIELLEKGRQRHIHLNATKVKHPVISWISMTLSECFAITEVHQRRHQWQAEQTLEMLENSSVT